MTRFTAYRELRGLAGSAVDLARLARLSFSNPHSYTKFRIIRAIRKRTGAKVFLEGGTFRGVTADRCCAIFDRVITVELDADLVDRARKVLAHRANCEVLEGDAAVLIPEVLRRPDIDGVLLSLDAHFSGPGTACGSVPEPAIQELEALAGFQHKICAIVIDDFRSFGTEAGFPRKWEVIKSAEELFATTGFKLSVFLDQVILERARS